MSAINIVNGTAPKATTQCPVCEGDGWIVDRSTAPAGELPQTKWCDYCQGEGRILTEFGREVVRAIEWHRKLARS